MTRVLTAAMAVALVGCGGPQDSALDSKGHDVATTGSELTWTQFLSKVYQEPDQEDVFIVNGDTTVEGWKNLRTFYEQAVLGGQKLIIDQTDGVDSKWTDTQKLNLTYCVSTGFGTRHSTVVQAMANATGEWSAATNVKYVYVSAQDGSCNTSNNNVLFDVRPVNSGGQYIARAFFPGDSRSARSVAIDGSAFTSSGNPTLTGVLRHELGHTLGFRHEHTRPEAGTCFEDNSWRTLTTYDSASVMHYPQCNGTGGWALTLTAKDISGAKLVYGDPGGGTGGGAGGGGGTGGGAGGGSGGGAGGGGGTSPTVQTFTGSVARGAWAAVPGITVKPSTTFTAVLTGTGDPDLYVRVGSAPTATRYTCRPYLDGPNETCSITVPASSSSVFVSINGYTAATYSMRVTYTKP